VNPQRWQQIKVALDRALELQGNLRTAYLDHITANDAELRGELQALIAAHDEAGETFLNTPAALGFSDLTDPDPWIGKHIGSYQLIELIGSGGMGEVYRAIRADDEYQKQVAIKLIRTDQSSAQLIRRFKTERQILASFDHANIARMFDGGTTEDGVPYFVMELIEGEPIDRYCEARKLDVSVRLGIFLEVCAAVHYAHQRLVIHRDLKPNNILVTENAEPKLLDFGIAKILAPSTQPEAAGPQVGPADKTKTEFRVLTLEYASPEQINGEALTAASDVYSLGVVLYQLLAGRRPFELQGSTRRALEEAVLSSDARPPSQIVGRNRIRSELDNIVLKALKKQPRERYATANDLADDLRHFLANEPISATADSIWYRAMQFTSRNKSSLQTAALGGALVALVLLSAGWLWRNALRNDATAVSANHAVGTAKVEGKPAPFAPPVHSVAVLPFVNLSGDSAQDYFSDGISEEMLNSLSRVDQLQVAARTSSFLLKGKNTDVFAMARKLNVGASLEGSVRRAGNTVRITVQLINGVNGFHIWSQTYDRDLADILAVQSDVAASVARQLEVKLVGDESDKIEVGGTRNAQAYDAFLRGMQTLANWDLAEAPLKAALVAFEKAISLDPGYAAAYAQRARVLDYLAIFLAKPQELAALQQEALKSARRAVALAPESGAARLELGQVLAYAMFDFSAALPEHEKALELEPGSARVQRAVTGFYSQLGRSERAISMARHAVGLDPQNVQSHITLGIVLEDARRYEESLVAIQHAVMLNPKSHYAGIFLYDTLLASGQTEGARELCESRSASLDEDTRHECLALAYHALGQQPRAERELARMKALDGDGRALGYAGVYAQWGQIGSALKWLSIAEKVRDTELQNLKVVWRLDPIRQSPEFKAVEARMNFPK
jgi:serine/threonine protein kinase/tetratricopeptide (TPR) repeat protein